MRRSIGVFCGLTALVAAACSSSRGGPYDHIARTSLPIVGGTADTTHTAVVAILITQPSMPNGFDECSGSIVQVKNGVAAVLTAAHCCGGDPSATDLQPSIVVLANDYANYEQDIGNSNPAAPAYPVIPGSVQWDHAYNMMDHDFCMLSFSGAPANTPTLKLPTSASDGLSVGVAVEFSGFGATSGSGSSNNSQRNHVTATVDQQVTSLIIQYSEGGATGGPCEGDSGGPALLPAGAAQSTQTVVATTSYGDATCMSYGVSSRVSSEIGPTGFITQYLNGNWDAGSSTPPSDSGANTPCDSCIMNVTSVGGACAAQVTTCENDATCSALLNCLGNCAPNDSTCANGCASTDQAGLTDYQAIFTCICSTGCPSQCAATCAPPDAGSMGSGTGTGTGTGSGSGKGSGTGSGTGTGSGIGTGTGAGSSHDAGGFLGGNGGNGGANGEAGGGKKGCAVAATPGSSTTAPAGWLAGLLFASGMAVSRRRSRRR